MIYYEKSDELGKYFINDEGIVYREGEVLFARFQAMVKSGEVVIENYEGSLLQAKENQDEEKRLAAIERAWRDLELKKSDLELLREVEKQFPSLEAKRQALRDYPASKDFMKKRPLI